MQTKDVLLVLGGLALGYFVSRMNWGRNTATAIGDVAMGVKDTATGMVKDVKEVAVDSAKKLSCENKLVEATSTMRFASAEAGDLFRKNFMATCMAS
jgi:hypothetical protein